MGAGHLEIFAAQQDFQPIVQEAKAGGAAQAIIVAVPIGGDAIFGAKLHSLEILVEDEVHHAANRVGPIGGRRAPGDDLDPLHQILGEGVDIDRSGRRRRHRPLPVQQHQRPAGAERPEVQRIDPGLAGTDVHAAVAGRETSGDRRHHVDEVGEVRWRLRLNVDVGDHADRSRRAIAIGGDAGAGDRDLLDSSRRLSTCLLGAGGRGCHAKRQ